MSRDPMSSHTPTKICTNYPFANKEEFNFAEMVIVEKFNAKIIVSE